MRARPSLLLLATACLAEVGCASRPAPEAPAASIGRACENAGGNSLHLTSTAGSQATAADADLDSILTQQPNDERLVQINRRMYQSLRSLDAELRRERRLAACEQTSLAQSSLASPTLRAQAGNQSSVVAGATSEADMAEGASTAASVPPSVAMAAAGTAHALRKTSMSETSGGGGNGATAPKIVPGSDNGVVAQRLRRAAEQETDPALRAKLWKEYTDYRRGTSTK